MPSPRYFCIDAGATHSRARLYDGAGQILAEAQAGPANASYDCGQAVASINDLWLKIGGGGFRSAILAIGGAGLYVPRIRDRFVAQLPAFHSIITMSDGYAALIGAGSGKPAALVTVGTGVAGHRLFADGTSIQRDALGWIIGDRGGGGWMGTRALRHAMEVWDGIAAPSALSHAVLQRIGGAEGLLSGALAGLNATRLAGFAPLVLDNAKAGCDVAEKILSRAVTYLERLVATLRCEDAPLYLNGGLAGAMAPLLVARLDRDLDEAEGDALYGCLLVALGKAPPEHLVFTQQGI